MKKLLTTNIFIDTSVFISNTYGTNDKFKQLSKIAGKGLVDIHVSEIILNELRRNIEIDLNSSKDLINDFRRKLNAKARILKSIEEYKPYFELPNVIVPIDIKRFNANIESFVKESKAKTIPHDLASINDVVQQYFSSEFPFDNGEKKREFPDAIVLSSIENWCKKLKKKMYVLSLDEGILNYKSDYLIPTKDLSGILNILNRELESKERLDKIDSLFMNFKLELKTEIESSFLSDYDTFGNDFEINEIKIISLGISPYNITSVNDREADLEVDVDLKFFADIDYDDYSFASHDNEDDVWYNIERNNAKFEKEVCFAVTITIDLNPPAGKKFADIRVSNIDLPDLNILTDELVGYTG